MIQKPGKQFGAKERAELAKEIHTQMAAMIAQEQLRPYEEPHENGRCIYVLQLRDDVWDCKSCTKLFKGVKDRRTAFYVGSTGKTNAIRLEQHLAYSNHAMKNETDAAQVAPHLLQRELWLEPHDSVSGSPLEKRIKWHAEMRALEEIVIPRIIREAGFAVYAGGETNPNGTWKRKSFPRKKRKTISKPS
jgi:hypothetical protein